MFFVVVFFLLHYTVIQRKRPKHKTLLKAAEPNWKVCTPKQQQQQQQKAHTQKTPLNNNMQINQVTSFNSLKVIKSSDVYYNYI